MTPFALSCFLILSKLTRHINLAQIERSKVLPGIIACIKSNDCEAQLKRSSFYLNSKLEEYQVVDLSRLFNQLIQNAQAGYDIVTSGIVGLIFYLLKMPKDENVSHMVDAFLTKFLHCRPMYRKGVIKNLAEVGLTTLLVLLDKQVSSF